MNTEKVVYFHIFALILNGQYIRFFKNHLVICLILLHDVFIEHVVSYVFDEKR